MVSGFQRELFANRRFETAMVRAICWKVELMDKKKTEQLMGWRGIEVELVNANRVR